MKVLSLFSGIGAFDLGLSWAGFETIAFCEIEPFARRVLAKHWPGVPCYDDVRSLTADRLRADGISVDVICGGFPCQDISVAGRGAGIGGERSGLWSEFARLIGEVGPRYVIVENVAALLGRGLGDVLGDLASLGYDAEWHCIPASAVGAPHIRDRVWIVAYADSRRGPGWDHVAGIRGAVPSQGAIGELLGSNGGQAVADTAGARCSEGRREPGGEIRHTAWRSQPERLGGEVADADGGGWREQGDVAEAAGDTGRPRLAIGPGTLREWSHAATTGDGWWAVEPDVGRVVDGVASRVDRLRGLGNSLVPQIPEIIGRAIMASEVLS